MTDTEGAGRFVGAPSIRVEYGPIGGPMDLVFASDGTDHPPQGVRGGKSGGKAGQQVRRRNGALEKLDIVTQIVLQEGETAIGLTCGGGGYGDPKTRDPERVRDNVSEGWVSRQRAQDVYGVVLAADSTVDEAATRALRGAVA